MASGLQALNEREDLWLPDYAGGGIFGLMDRIMRGLGCRTPLAGSAAANGGAWPRVSARTVLVVFDGLGDQYLRTHGVGSRLLDARFGALTSVFPSTTAAAITTFMTGLSPAAHGLNGWTCRGHGTVGLFEPLPLRYCDSGKALRNPLRLRRLFPYPTLYERLACPSVVVAPAYLVDTGYSARHSRGAAVGGYDSLDELPELIEAALEQIPERGFVYAYVPHFDGAAHDEGMGSAALFGVFERLEACFGELLARVRKPGVQLLATADHGLIDAPEEAIICLGAQPEIRDMLAMPTWGERRAAFCAVRPECRRVFAAAIDECWPAQFDIVEGAEVIAGGLLGPGEAHRDLRQRVGEFLLLPRGSSTIVDAASPASVHPMRAVHGGLSRAEMTVPLIAAAE